MKGGGPFGFRNNSFAVCSCLQDILYDKCIAGTIVISEKNIAISTLFGTMDITVKKPCENGGKETHCTRRKALGPTG